MLDVGGSSGRHLWELLGGSPRMLVGLDANLVALLLGAMAWESRGIGGMMHWVCADVLEMPFKAAIYTHVQSFATLNYLPIRAALLELGRVLAPGGRLVFTVEGNGLWKNFWDTAGSLRRRVNLLRGLAGNTLLGLGLDWQRGRLTRRLSRNTQYGPKTISRIVERCGFDVGRCEVLREYQSHPWIIGVSATKRGRGPEWGRA